MNGHVWVGRRVSGLREGMATVCKRCSALRLGPLAETPCPQGHLMTLTPEDKANLTRLIEGLPPIGLEVVKEALAEVYRAQEAGADDESILWRVGGHIRRLARREAVRGGGS